MQIHSNSTTTGFVRGVMRSSSESCRTLAGKYGVSTATVHRWKHREGGKDKSSRPLRLRNALSRECEEAALRLRRQGLCLDACLDALTPLFPEVRRATLHRLFVKHGLRRLEKPESAKAKKFKRYEPGFIHVDSFQLPALGKRKRHCYLAIDRATRLVFLKVYDRKTKEAAVDFLERLIAFFPFRIHRLLTDNGGEYTHRHYRAWPSGPKTPHPFGVLCQAKGISHRLTKAYTPRTNGMVERLVKTTKTATVHSKKYPSHQALDADLRAWMGIYNLCRPHGGIQRRTPENESLRWYKEKPEIFTRDPASLIEVFTTY